MTHIGLFEGIGGFSLAARWAGWETIAWCEWDEKCQRVLKYHFPKAKGYGDITTTDFTGYAGQIDVLTGGFPCQPYSSAGKRLGTADDRHLWPEMLRAIREIQPRWVVGENVRGLINWNGGLVFDEVQSDLEAAGYEVTPFLLPACAVGAPHERYRIWIIAFKDTCKIRCNGAQPEKEPCQRQQREFSAGNDVRVSDAANAEESRASMPYSSPSGKFKLRTENDALRCNGAWTSPNAKQIRQPRSGRPERRVWTKEGEQWKASWSYNDGRWPTQPPYLWPK